MKEQLPPQVLAGLFNNSLVYTGEKIKTETDYDVQQPVAINDNPVEPKAEPAVAEVHWPGKWNLGNYEN